MNLQTQELGRRQELVQQVNKKRLQWAPLCGGQPEDALLTELLGKPLKLEMNLIVFHSCIVTHRMAVQNLVSCSLIDIFRWFYFFYIYFKKFLSWTERCFPGGSDGKESACNAGDLGLIPGSGRSPGEGTATQSSSLA